MKFLIFLSLLVFPFHNSFSMFSMVEGVESAAIKRVAVSPFNQKLVYMASEKALFKSEDGGQTFKKVYGVKDEVVRHLFFDSHLADVLYLAASRHVFRVNNGVEKIFSSPDEAEILTAAEFEGRIYAGTTDGIYFASEDILNWGRLNNFRNDVSVYSIAAAQETIYIASSKGIYLLERQGKIKRVFIVKNSDVEEEIGLIPGIIKIDIFDENKIWAGTNQGVFVSLDKGDSWSKLYIEGVDNLDVNSLVQKTTESDMIYLASNKGFFKVNLEEKTSQNIFGGVYSSKINWAAAGADSTMYLAASRGLFVEDSSVLESYENGLEEFLKNEPSIEEIRQAALKYNEVHPDKIRKWRNGLKFRALFPNIDLDYNKSIYGTAGTNNYDGRAFVGPRDWAVGFSWDVADVIWNTYEDDVDTRSRLNTQLRLDMLDEINRVYFERLRLKKEIKTSSSFGEDLFQKQLRLKELDAIIDGYTGGYFSKRVRELDGTK